MIVRLLLDDAEGEAATVCIDKGRAGSSLLFVALLLLVVRGIAECGGVDTRGEAILALLEPPLEFELELQLAYELEVDVELVEPLRLI